MGGFGSGRYGGGPLVEDGLTINLDKLRRDQLLVPGMYRRFDLSWSWVHSGETFATISATANAADERGWIKLEFTRRDRDTGEAEAVEQWIDLETIAQPFGGRRWFAVCPFTGARCTKLIMPAGATRFAARKAWRRIAYRCQREAPYDRALRAAFKRRRRLGDHRGGIGDPIRKPRWMRWSTFDRQLAEIERVEARVEGYLAGFLDRLQSRAS